jgi:hypothetical protein
MLRLLKSISQTRRPRDHEERHPETPGQPELSLLAGTKEIFTEIRVRGPRLRWIRREQKRKTWSSLCSR